MVTVGIEPSKFAVHPPAKDALVSTSKLKQFGSWITGCERNRLSSFAEGMSVGHARLLCAADGFSVANTFSSIYSLTPPEVNPLTRYFSMTRNSTTTGMVAIRDVANTYSQSTSYLPKKEKIPTVRGFLVSVKMRVKATTNSFHDWMNTKMTVVTSPGRASGRTILRTAPSLVHPSIHAASSRL